MCVCASVALAQVLLCSRPADPCDREHRREQPHMYDCTTDGHNSVMLRAQAPSRSAEASENLDAAVVTWYCQTNDTWEPYPADISELLEREFQHVRQGISLVGWVIHWNFSRKNSYAISVNSMQQKNIETGKIRSIKRTAHPAPEPPRSQASNHTCMIARQIHGHNTVMIRASRSQRSKTKWWLSSGSQVFAAMQSDTTEYAVIFPVPSMTHCYDPSWQLLTQWPYPTGYIKKHNLVTPEQWESESCSEPVRLALMDDSGVWCSSGST